MFFITKGEMRDILLLFLGFGSNLMCHNFMRLWHIFQNDRSHEIVTHQVGIKF
jgi:hypothetical protein